MARTRTGSGAPPVKDTSALTGLAVGNRRGRGRNRGKDNEDTTTTIDGAKNDSNKNGESEEALKKKILELEQQLKTHTGGGVVNTFHQGTITTNIGTVADNINHCDLHRAGIEQGQVVDVGGGIGVVSLTNELLQENGENDDDDDAFSFINDPTSQDDFIKQGLVLPEHGSDRMMNGWGGSEKTNNINPAAIAINHQHLAQALGTLPTPLEIGIPTEISSTVTKMGATVASVDTSSISMEDDLASTATGVLGHRSSSVLQMYNEPFIRSIERWTVGFMFRRQKIITAQEDVSRSGMIAEKCMEKFKELLLTDLDKEAFWARASVTVFKCHMQRRNNVQSQIMKQILGTYCVFRIRYANCLVQNYFILLTDNYLLLLSRVASKSVRKV